MPYHSSSLATLNGFGPALAQLCTIFMAKLQYFNIIRHGRLFSGLDFKTIEHICSKYKYTYIL